MLHALLVYLKQQVVGKGVDVAAAEGVDVAMLMWAAMSVWAVVDVDVAMLMWAAMLVWAVVDVDVDVDVDVVEVVVMMTQMTLIGMCKKATLTATMMEKWELCSGDLCV
jgi:hypothetical protein